MGEIAKSEERAMASLRRNARERKEFLYRKSLQEKDRAEYERKMKMKRLIENGDKIPKELKHEEAEVRREMAMLGKRGLEMNKMEDDEYQLSGIEDPKLVLTTSNDPSSRLASFAKELKLIIPNCTRVNRGHMGIGELVNTCRANSVTDILIVHETRGEPDGLIVSHLPYGPTVYFSLHNVLLRHDINPSKKMTLATPNLIFHNFGSTLGQRVETVLKNLFPPAKAECARTMTFYNESDFISFRHHRVQKVDFKTVETEEMGPRFEMKLFRIRLGSLDQPEAKVEYELRPFMNSAKRRRFLEADPKNK